MTGHFTRTTPPADAFTERGAALLTAIFALLLLTLLGLSLTHLSLTALNVSNNDRESTEAFHIAEAGIEHAVALIQAAGPGSYNSIATAGNLSATPSATSADRIPVAGCSIGGGTYTVTVANGAVSGTLRVTSTGAGRNGSVAVIESIVGAETAVAIVSNGNLTLGGITEFGGVGGVVHANGNLNIPGIVKAEQHLSASGTLTITSGIVSTGTPPYYNDNPKDLRSAQPQITVPTITPSTFISQPGHQPDYIMRSNGQVKVTETGAIHNVTSGAWNGWTWSAAGGWSYNTIGTPSGTYYAEGGSIRLSGIVGSSGSPANITLIADGSVELSSNSYLASDTPGYSIIAGTDVKVSGNTSISGGGMIYAGHQLELGGNSQIDARIFAANLSNSSYPVSGTTSHNLVNIASGVGTLVNGNLTMTNGGSGGGFKTYSWRERRD